MVNNYSNHFFEIFGLIPFLILTIIMQSWIALIIVLTGLLYHLYDTQYTKILDIFFIIILTIYVNTMTKWNYTYIITLCVIAIALCNSYYNFWFVHVFLVQFPLAICLYYFEINNK